MVADFLRLAAERQAISLLSNSSSSHRTNWTYLSAANLPFEMKSFEMMQSDNELFTGAPENGRVEPQ